MPGIAKPGICGGAFLAFRSAVSSTFRISSGLAPSPVINSFMSTENSTSNFLPGSPPNGLAVAVPLIPLILP